MKFLFLFALCCILGHSNADVNLEIKPLESSAGLMFDHHARLYFTDKQWRLITYLDLKKHEQQMEKITKSHKMLNDLCNVKYCENLNRMEVLYKMTLDKKKAFEEMTKVPTEGSKAVPHYVSGFPVYSRSVFEVSTIIEKFEENNEYLGELYKERAYVSKFSVLSDEELQVAMDRLDKFYEKNFKLHENVANESEKLTKDRKVMQNVDDHLEAVTMACISLEKIYSTLVESMIYGQGNVLHPEVMSAQEFINDLSKTEEHISENYRYPYPLEIELAHHLMSMAKINIYMFKNKLIYFMDIPLMHKMQYRIFDVLPLPMPVAENTYVYIQPSANMLAISENMESYATMDHTRECTSIAEGMLLCKSVPVYFANKRPICEVELMTGATSIPSSCNTRVVLNKLNVVQKLNRFNSWILVRSESEKVEVECGNSTQALELPKIGIMTMKEDDCVARTATMKLVTEDTRPLMNTPYETNTVAKILEDNCCTKEKAMETIAKVDRSTVNVSIVNLRKIDSISYKL